MGMRIRDGNWLTKKKSGIQIRKLRVRFHVLSLSTSSIMLYMYNIWVYIYTCTYMYMYMFGFISLMNTREMGRKNMVVVDDGLCSNWLIDKDSL